jgi:hypothetical protein
MSKTFVALSVLTFTSLACSIFVGGPDYPSTPVPVSTAAVQDLQDQVKQAIADGAASGSVTLKITEEQITSYLAQQLQLQPSPVVTDPQVLLRDGQMTVFGKIQQGIFLANATITMMVSVDQNGQPQIAITHQDFGPIPAPQDLNAAISTLVQQAFTGSLGPVAIGFRLENISIMDGVMTVTGRVK